MKFRKIMMIAGLTAALAGMSVFCAFAAEDDEVDVDTAVDDSDSESEWYSPDDGVTWYYYINGKAATDKWIDGGYDYGDHYWYYVGSDGIMYANTTREINGVMYTFEEDGTYVEKYVGAQTGDKDGNTFNNKWSNLRMENMAGTPESEEDFGEENQYVTEDYASIGSPKMTQDLVVYLGDIDLEVYYLDVSAASVSGMSADQYAAAFANAVKGSKTFDGNVTTVTIAGEPYSKVSIADTSKKYGKQRDYYFRKKDNFMIVIEVDGTRADADQMAALVGNFTTAQ